MVELTGPVTGIAGGRFSMGVIDGSSPHGAIQDAGTLDAFSAPPKEPEPTEPAWHVEHRSGTRRDGVLDRQAGGPYEG